MAKALLPSTCVAISAAVVLGAAVLCMSDTSSTKCPEPGRGVGEGLVSTDGSSTLAGASAVGEAIGVGSDVGIGVAGDAAAQASANTSTRVVKGRHLSTFFKILLF